MILFPAIDLKNGQCVRLEQGDMARATVFNLDPAAQARLRRARVRISACGRSRRRLCRQADERASGRGDAQGGHHAGAARRRHPRSENRRGLARQGHRARDHRHRGGARSRAGERTPRKKFPGRVAVGLDARDGKVAVEGWAETSEVTALEIAQRFEDAGVAAIIFTDIARDGLLKGLNLDATIALAERISIPVIASGGFASIDDVKALLAPRAKKLAGAIAGRALYDGRLDPAAALALIRNARAAA